MCHRPGRHGILDEGKRAVRGHVRDAPKADSTDTLTAHFGSHCYNGFGLDSPAVLVIFRAAEIGFVRLDGTREAIPIGPNYRPP